MKKVFAVAAVCLLLSCAPAIVKKHDPYKPPSMNEVIEKTKSGMSWFFRNIPEMAGILILDNQF